jgi:hypothetical protein
MHKSDRIAIASLQIKQKINQLRETVNKDNPFGYLMGNLTRIRAPAVSGEGRYDYFYYGKLTNRGSEFQGFSSHVKFIVEDFYGKLTSLIEKSVSFHVEKQKFEGDRYGWSLRGAPVTFVFEKPLQVHVFDRFIELTFDKGKGPFRLLGNPLRLSDSRVHVYGIDMHLWQQIYLDMSLYQFTAVIPEGTCGNTIHRLSTNIQRYLDPKVTVFIGETKYEDLISDTLRQVNSAS